MQFNIINMTAMISFNKKDCLYDIQKAREKWMKMREELKERGRGSEKKKEREIVRMRKGQSRRE